MWLIGDVTIRRGLLKRFGAVSGPARRSGIHEKARRFGWRPAGRYGGTAFAARISLRIASPRRRNASSTFWPLFALVYRYFESNAFANWSTCFSSNTAWFTRSALFTAITVGTRPPTRTPPPLQSSR